MRIVTMLDTINTTVWYEGMTRFIFLNRLMGGGLWKIK